MRLASMLTCLLLAMLPARAQLPPPPPLLSGPPAMGAGPAQAPAGNPPPPLALSNTSSLDFGAFVAGSGGTITISPNGGRSRSGDVILMYSSGAGNAAFSVSSGAADQSVIVSLPADGEVALSNGPHAMAVRNFTNGSGTLVPLGAGNAALGIGATLVVAPNQAPGHYSGTFRLTVNYQ